MGILTFESFGYTNDGFPDIYEINGESVNAASVSRKFVDVATYSL